jgi:hypothetical protein
MDVTNLTNQDHQMRVTVWIRLTYRFLAWACWACCADDVLIGIVVKVKDKDRVCARFCKIDLRTDISQGSLPDDLMDALIVHVRSGINFSRCNRGRHRFLLVEFPGAIHSTWKTPSTVTFPMYSTRNIDSSCEPWPLCEM